MGGIWGSEGRVGASLVGQGLGDGKGEGTWGLGPLPTGCPEGFCGRGVTWTFLCTPKSRREAGPDPREVELTALWPPAGPGVSAVLPHTVRAVKLYLQEGTGQWVLALHTWPPLYM